jgi:hypothetical protein
LEQAGCIELARRVCAGLTGKSCLACLLKEKHVSAVLAACTDQVSIDAACGVQGAEEGETGLNPHDRDEL